MPYAAGERERGRARTWNRGCDQLLSMCRFSAVPTHMWVTEKGRLVDGNRGLTLRRAVLGLVQCRDAVVGPKPP